MNEVRFRLGVPRVGSAAADAERGNRLSHSPGISLRPRAGSAAYAAEQEKKAAGGDMSPRGMTGFSLRGQNGVISRGEVSAPRRPTEVAEDLPKVAAQEKAAGADAPQQEEQALAGPLLPAASRFQTLVRSLFGSENSASKS